MENKQKDELFDQMNQALREGNMSTFVELAQQYPMPPQVAKAVSTGFGVDWLKSSGFNLSEAEKSYGSNWLDR